MKQLVSGIKYLGFIFKTTGRWCFISTAWKKIKQKLHIHLYQNCTIYICSKYKLIISCFILLIHWIKSFFIYIQGISQIYSIPELELCASLVALWLCWEPLSWTKELAVHLVLSLCEDFLPLNCHQNYLHGRTHL